MVHRFPLRFTILLFISAFHSFVFSLAQAQEVPSNVPSRPHLAHQAHSPDKETDATYSNPRFGISFHVPQNYAIAQGQGMAVRPGDFGFVPGDPGEYLFAKLERAGRDFPYPVFAPSAAALYFGIYLGLTEEACLAPLDFPPYKSKGTLSLDGVTFHWSAEPWPNNSPTLLRSPYGEEYFREYAGLVNNVCYEFHLRTWANSRENALPELESILSTVKVFPRTLSGPQAPGQPETPFPLPDDVLDLFKLAAWKISYPRSYGAFARLTRPRKATLGDPSQTSKILAPGYDASQSNAISLAYFSDLSDGDAATAAIIKIENEVCAYLEQHQWSAVHPGQRGGGRKCPGYYEKDGAHLDISEGTGRCTMNSPCTQFDSLTLDIRLPIQATPAQ